MTMNPYLAEFIGTATLLLFGAGVVANVKLKRKQKRNHFFKTYLNSTLRVLS